ncbi:MAG: ATP-binding protein [Candidatus Aminicenantes bacterium]|nr:ATP-binding protein [Candidatus Aminicenantes bacterium]
MMEDLSLHILDIAENAVEAKARRVDIRVEERRSKDRLILQVTDDGRGMGPRRLARARDPFYTTKKVRRIGLGLPLLAQAAESAGGALALRSEPGHGTKVRATFKLGHIDRQPLGDMAETLVALLVGHQGIEFNYTHVTDTGRYVFRSRDAAAFGPSGAPAVSGIRKKIRDGLARLRRTS